MNQHSKAKAELIKHIRNVYEMMTFPESEQFKKEMSNLLSGMQVAKNTQRRSLPDGCARFESLYGGYPAPVAEDCPKCSFGKLKDHKLGKICEGCVGIGKPSCGYRSWRPHNDNSLRRIVDQFSEVRK